MGDNRATSTITSDYAAQIKQYRARPSLLGWRCRGQRGGRSAGGARGSARGAATVVVGLGVAVAAACVFLTATAPASADLINQPPVAEAGPDQTIYLYEAAFLFGSAFDPEGDPIRYWSWEVEAAPETSLRLLQDATTPIAALTGDVPGDYVISLKASDGAWGPEDTTVVHCITNLPPVAVLQADVTRGPAPLTVSFDGSGSYDPEAGPLSFFWNFADGNTSREPAVQHTYMYPGMYVVTLTVTDDHSNMDVDSMLIEALWVVPEPGTLGLLGVGLVPLLGRGCRWRRGRGVPHSVRNSAVCAGEEN